MKTLALCLSLLLAAPVAAQPTRDSPRADLAAHLMEIVRLYYPDAEFKADDLFPFVADWITANPGTVTGPEARAVAEAVASLFHADAAATPPPDNPAPQVVPVPGLDPGSFTPQKEGSARPFLQVVGSIGLLAGAGLLWRSERTMCRPTAYGLGAALPDYVEVGDITEENVSLTSEGVCLDFTDRTRQRMGYIAGGVGLGMVLLSYAIKAPVAVAASPANGGSLMVSHTIRW